MNNLFLTLTSLNTSLWIRRIDTRTILLSILLLTILIVINLNVLTYLLLTIVECLTLFFLKNSLKIIKKFWSYCLLIIGITFLLHILFSANITIALLYSWRVLLFSLLAIIFVITTTPDNLVQVFWKILPNKSLSFIRNMGLAFLLGVRFIPDIIHSFEKIKYAQIARGADFSGNIIRRVKAIIPLLIPAIAISLQKADKVGDSLILRGWENCTNRSCYHQMKFGLYDLINIAILVIIVIIYLFLVRL